MPPRQLRATLSNSADLSPFQKLVLQDLSKTEDDLMEQRTLLYSVATTFQQEREANREKTLAELTTVLQKVRGLDEQEAIRVAKALLHGHPGKLNGVHSACILQWRFDAESFWRGPPENLRLVRFIKSMISTRFRADATVASERWRCQASL
jgi:hypothetical protein